MTGKKDICELSLKNLEDWFRSKELPLFRAGQLYDWLWKKGVRSFDQMTDLSVELRGWLGEEFYTRTLQQKQKQQSSDGTIKLVFSLHDDLLVEGVIIPSAERTTACISSQAGCALGCKFCATGMMGFKRHLFASEIFDQYMELNHESIAAFGHPLDNIVYMGMGEPLLNYEQVVNSIEHLTDKKHGQGLSPQRITVSTAGITDGIKRLADDGIKAQLAVSLHTANQEKRVGIMPLAKKFPLEDLSAAMKHYHEVTQSRITIEYLLLYDVNDGLKDARELAAFCRDFPVKVNIIEYNEVAEIPYKRSTPERTIAFKKFLEERNMIVQVRQSKGQDIQAACGQLAGKAKQ